MSARLRQRLARREDARTRNHALLDRLLQRPVGAARVAHGREAAVEHALHDRQRLEYRQHVRLAGIGAEIRVRGEHVHVAVDHAGHDGLAGDVDHRRTGNVERRGADRGNARAVDGDVVTFEQTAGSRIEHIAAAKQGNGHGGVP